MKTIKKMRIAWVYRADPAAEQFLLQRVWFFSLSVLGIITTASFLWGTYLFFYPVGTSAGAGAVVESDAFDRDVLTKLLAQFDERAARHGTLKTNPPTTPVPKKN